jgi:hypothetical protein
LLKAFGLFGLVTKEGTRLGGEIRRHPHKCAGSCSVWVNLPRPSSLHRKPREIRPVLRRIGNTVSVCVRSDRLDHDGRRCLPDQPMLLASFIAANAWMSRQPMSLQSICSNVLELYKNRDEITDNEKWRQELEHCTTTARSRSTNTTRLALNTN